MANSKPAPDELEVAQSVYLRRFPYATAAVPYFAGAGRILLPEGWKRPAVVVPIDGDYVIEREWVNRPVPWLRAAFERDYRRFLQMLHQINTIFDPGSFPDHDVDEVTPYFPNGFFGPMDAVALAGFLATLKPLRYVEIGSGNSTRIARSIIATAQLNTNITCIDPAPRKAIARIADQIISDGLLQVSMQIFECLQPNDILFFDGSHVVFSGTDCQRFFLEILPALPVGVYVHVHDIFLPDDYPQRMRRAHYNEQQLLAAFLYKNDEFEVVLPISYLHGRGDCPEGVSFWMKRVADRDRAR